MDWETRQKLAAQIHSLTHPTDPSFQLSSSPVLKTVKKLGKESPTNIKAIHELLLDKIREKNSKTRYLALQIMDEFFMRSKYYRSLIAIEFRNMLELIVGALDSLPPPKESALVLRHYALQTVEKWRNTHGNHEKQIELGYQHAKLNMKVKFPSEVSPLTPEQQRAIERQNQEIRTKYQKIKSKIDGFILESESLIKQLQNSFEILIPTLDSILKEEKISTETSVEPPLRSSMDTFLNLLENPENPKEELTLNDTIDQVGLGSVNYQLSIQIGPPKETTENELLLKIVRENYKLLRVHTLKKIDKWMRLLVKVDDSREKEEILKKLMDLKGNIGDVEGQCIKLGVTPDSILGDKVWVPKETSFVDESGVQMNEVSFEQETVETTVSSSNSTPNVEEMKRVTETPIRRRMSLESATPGPLTPITGNSLNRRFSLSPSTPLFSTSSTGKSKRKSAEKVPATVKERLAKKLQLEF